MAPPAKHGQTFWDFLTNIFKDTRSFLITLALLLILIVTLLLMGYIGYDKEGLHVGKPKSNPAQAKSTSSECFDADLKLCIDSARNTYKLDYVTESILIDVNVEKIKPDSLLERVRIVYTIRSLKKLEKKNFTEMYNTTSNATIKHVFGTEKENLSGNGNVFDIPLNMDINETKTILTGCDYFFPFPLLNHRNEVSGDMPVDANQDVYIYPNQEDVIKSLTIRISSNTLKIRPMAQGARHYKGDDIIKEDPSLYFDQNGLAKYTNRSISHNWKNLMPKERVCIYFEWE